MSNDLGMKRCPRCGAMSEPSAFACPFCGEPFAADMDNTMVIADGSAVPSAYGGAEERPGEATVILTGGDRQQQPSSYQQSYDQQPYSGEYSSAPSEETRFVYPSSDGNTPRRLSPAKKREKGNYTLLLVFISLATLLLTGAVTYFVLDHFNQGESDSVPDTAAISTEVDSTLRSNIDDDVARENAMLEEIDQPEIIDQDYIAGQANRLQIRSRELTKDDLVGMNAVELRLLRNYIYAQYGQKFEEEDLREFFSAYSWYNPTTSDVSSQLSTVEKKNAATIKSLE